MGDLGIRHDPPGHVHSHDPGIVRCEAIGPDVKLFASHLLPWDVQISGTYQFTQGPNLLANWAVPKPPA